jgi:H+/Cl- antiporter ClcA
MSRRLLMLTLIGCALVLAVGVGSARASTATSLQWVTYDGSSFWNYDFDSQSAVSTNVDWPVDLVFYGNASQSKVYSKMGWIWGGSNEYQQVNAGSGPVWVATGGRKNTFCTDTHYRVYAPPAGYFVSIWLGDYVIATAHLDKNECGSSPTYGWNETAEGNVASRAATVWGAAAVTKNAAGLPDGTSTGMLLNNAQTGWQGNHYFDNNGQPTLIKVP